MAISFDGVNKIISLSSTSLDLRDLWSKYVDWVTTGDNAKFPVALTTVGGEEIDSGVYIPVYLFIQNGWFIRPMEANHTLRVSDGIIIRVGGGDPFTDTLGSFRVNTRYSQPVSAISYDPGTGGASGGLTAQQVADAVWNEPVINHAVAGTTGKSVDQIKKLVTGLY